MMPRVTVAEVITVILATVITNGYGQVPCARFPTLANGLIVSINDLQLNFSRIANVTDTVVFVCSFNYTLSGSMSSQCQADGNWSYPLPTCRAVTNGDVPCSNIFSEINSTGTVSPGPYYIGNAAIVTCNSGLTIKGLVRNSTTYVCGPNKVWNGPTPTCISPWSSARSTGSMPEITSPVHKLITQILLSLIMYFNH